LGKIRNVTGAVERKNRYLQEMIKTILNEFDSSKYFLGGSCKHILLSFKSCYLEIRVEKDSI